MEGGTQMTQIQITLPDSIMNGVKLEAAKLGVTPNILMRIQLCSLYSNYANKDEIKSYIVTLENWREAEAYVKDKYPRYSIGDFAAKCVISEMKKHPK
jgi:hypothetical protein